MIYRNLTRFTHTNYNIENTAIPYTSLEGLHLDSIVYGALTYLSYIYICSWNNNLTPYRTESEKRLKAKPSSLNLTLNLWLDPETNMLTRVRELCPVHPVILHFLINSFDKFTC